MYSVSHSFPNFSVSRVFSVPLHSLPWAVSQPGKFISVPSSSLMLRLYRAVQCWSLGCCDAHKPTGSCCFLHWGNLGCLGAPEMWILFCFLFILFFFCHSFFLLLSFYEWGIYSVPLRTPIISTLTMEPNSPKAIERALGQTVSFYGVTSAWVVGGGFCSDSSNGAHQGYKHSASHPCVPRTTPLPPCP